MVYYGPDLQVPLSPAFLEAHCLGVRYDQHRSDEVGIGFEPVRRTRVPGIRGTLWLKLEGLELRRLEFEYTEHRRPSSTMCRQVRGARSTARRIAASRA